MRTRSYLGAAPFLLLTLAAVGCHQPAGDVTDRMLIGEVMMRSQLAENLRAISMDGGRVSGTPNAAKAEEYVAERSRAYGLQNVRHEPFAMESWISRETVVTLLDDPPQRLEGAVALGRTISTPPEGVTAGLIDIGEGKPEDFEAYRAEIPGKFVIVHGGWTRRARIQRALEHGAAGVVVMSRPEREPIIGNGHDEPRPEPLVVIRRDERLLERLAAGEELSVNIRLETENWPCSPRNVVAEIPGNGPLADEVVILCAHLDGWHLAEAAIDNGTGSAAILETARALAAVDWKPRRTVRFIWFMAEEIGLLGSRAYVRDHADELDNIVAVVNVDMPGSPRGMVAFGHPEIEGFLESVAADLSAYELSVRVRDPTGMWSDHAPFMVEGVCTLAVRGDLGPGVKHYHTANDRYDEVDRRATNEAAAVFAVLVRRLADAPDRPGVRSEPVDQDAS
jgi:hypothetical protein